MGAHATAVIQFAGEPDDPGALAPVRPLTPEKAAAAAFDLPPEGVDLDALERRLVEQALARTSGNKTRAGALLGLTRDQVRYRMQKYGLVD